MPMLAELVDGVIGVDPHRDTLTAAAVSHLGGVLAHTTTSADAAGYQRLLGFAQAQLPGRRCWAVEGGGQLRRRPCRVLQQHGEPVVEVGRPRRPASRSGAKSDALDAVRAAREALGQDRPTTPRRRGQREALRVLLTTRRCATLARVAAIDQLKALIVGAPEELRAELPGAAPPARSTTAPACGRGRPGRWSTKPPCGHGGPPLSASRRWTPRPTSSRPSWPCWSQRPHRGCWRSPASAPERRPGAGQLVACRPVPLRGRLCRPGRHQPDPCLLWAGDPLPAQPWRRPTAQPRLAHHLAGAPTHRSRHLRLHGPPHRRGQESTRRQAVLRRVIARQLFRLLKRCDQPGVEVLRAG
jgi:Transposase